MKSQNNDLNSYNYILCYQSNMHALLFYTKLGYFSLYLKLNIA